MVVFCYLCLEEKKSPTGLKIHEARSTKHYKNRLDVEDPDHKPIESYFEEVEDR